MKDKITIPEKIKFIKTHISDIMESFEVLEKAELIDDFNEIAKNKFKDFYKNAPGLPSEIIYSFCEYFQNISSRRFTKAKINEVHEVTCFILYQMDEIAIELDKLVKRRMKQTNQIANYLLFLNMFNKNIVSKYKN